MKATFKRDYSYWPAWLPITVYFLAAIGLFIVMGIGSDNYYLLMMPVAFVFYFVAMIRNPFHITDDNKLTGNGFIDVELINRLERKHSGACTELSIPYMRHFALYQTGKQSKNVSSL